MRGNDSRIYHLDLTAEEMLSLGVMAAVGVAGVEGDVTLTAASLEAVDNLGAAVGGTRAVVNAVASAVAAINLQGARAVAHIKADMAGTPMLTARTQFGFAPPGSGPSSRG